MNPSKPHRSGMDRLRRHAPAPTTRVFPARALLDSLASGTWEMASATAPRYKAPGACAAGIVAFTTMVCSAPAARAGARTKPIRESRVVMTVSFERYAYRYEDGAAPGPRLRILTVTGTACPVSPDVGPETERTARSLPDTCRAFPARALLDSLG